MYSSSAGCRRADSGAAIFCETMGNCRINEVKMKNIKL